jgi:membrane-bound inhibitor of C-type lysozyme
MATSLKQLIAACACALAAAGLCAPALAAPKHETHPKAVKVLKDKAAKAKKAAPKEEAEPEPDVSASTAVDYACELNNKLTIYTNEGDDAHIALRWKDRLQQLDRVGTTTGAQRFENVKTGLIWIGIPAKGMLLDSKQNRQLANECKNAEQAKPVVATAPVEEKKS